MVVFEEIVSIYSSVLVVAAPCTTTIVWTSHDVYKILDGQYYIYIEPFSVVDLSFIKHP